MAQLCWLALHRSLAAVPGAASLAGPAAGKARLVLLGRRPQLQPLLSILLAVVGQAGQVIHVHIDGLRHDCIRLSASKVGEETAALLL